jgi:hypothetical protein
MAFTEEQKRILAEIDSKLATEEKEGSIVDKAARYAAAINTGAASYLPAPVQRKLQEWGITLAQPQGAVEAGLAGVGQALPLAVGGVGALTARTAAPWLSQLVQQGGARGVAAGVGQDIARTATTMPGTFWAAETLGAFGAGAVPEMVEAETPMGQQLAGLAGGLAGGLTPAAVPRVGRSLLENLAPFTQAGGELRAARQMQARAVDPELAAMRAKQAPEGITPARATGEEMLLAQERRILEDAPPSLSQRVQDDLLQAQQKVEDSLVNFYGPGRSAKAWEQDVMQRVAAPGTKIETGSTSRMLDQAYQSFDPLYAKAKNVAIPTEGIVGDIRKAIGDPEIIAGDAQRKVIRNWFASQYNNLVKNRAKEGVIDSGDLLELRSSVRAKQREYGKSLTEDSNQYRQILQGIEAQLTKSLETGLSGEPLTALRTADSQYRQYKIIEDAVFRSGDGPFTPDRMAESIRLASSSKSAYARGVNDVEQELRLLAQSGRRVEEVLGDPAAARALVRDFNPRQLRPIKTDFVNTAVNKSLRVDREFGTEGNQYISGADLKVFLKENRSTAKALGFADAELNRLNRIANELIVMERKSPAAVANLFEDGPATILQLGATLIGAKGGQRAAGQGGIGSSLVLAQFMAKKARDNLARLTSDKAVELMNQAVTDKNLYAALLTKPTDSPKQVKQAVQTLNAWFINNFAEEETGPSFDEEQRRILEDVNQRLRQGQVAP